MTDFDLYRAGIIRPISPRRAKVLRKRGEYVRWSSDMDWYVWEPHWLSPNPATADGLPWLTHPELLQQGRAA